MSELAILAFPEPDSLFILDMDALGHSLGTELSQVLNGKQILIGYASKTLSSTERRYCVTRKELRTCHCRLHTTVQILPPRTTLHCPHRPPQLNMAPGI
jgi:hypothetical protein